MKHDIKITLILIAFFIIAQLIGLSLLSAVTVEKVVNGQRTVSYDEQKIGEVPKVSGLIFFLYVVVGIGIGTALVLFIIKFNKVVVWKVWFFLAVVIAISMALRVLINDYIALAIAVILALLKLYRPGVVTHNVTEVLMYSGIAIFLVPMLDGRVFWAVMLLVAISIYDFIAVFKSKHMVTMAKFQSENKLFAGLYIPYVIKKGVGTGAGKKDKQEGKATISLSAKSAGKELPDISKKMKIIKSVSTERKSAVLGGGDIAFPLIFTGAVMQSITTGGLSKMTAFYHSLIITLTTTIALALLFIFAKKDKFYPAMPIISAGCIVGYLIVLLI